jgi:hypothetical protein
MSASTAGPIAACEPEMVTGWVDGALEPVEAERIARHVSLCEACRQQAEDERILRGRLRSELSTPQPAPSLGPRIRTRLQAESRVRWSRVLLPLAASLLLAFGWMRSTPSFLAWELARDHRHCFGEGPLEPQVWTEDALEARGWFEKQGTETPWLPDEAGAVGLVGARYCPLPGLSRAAHFYYAGEKGQLSVFVVGRPLLLQDEASRLVGGLRVVLRRKEGQVLGVVGSEKEDVEALERAIDVTVARLVASR